MIDRDFHLATLLKGYAPDELASDTVDALAEYFVPQRLPANHLLMKQGAPGYEMYLIVDGNVEVRWFPFGRSDARGTFRSLATLGAGDLVGEMSVVFNKPRSADVVTLGDTLVYKLTKGNYIHVCSEYPGFGSRVEQVARGRAGGKR